MRRCIVFDPSNSPAASLAGVFSLDRRTDARYEYEPRGDAPCTHVDSVSFAVRVRNISAGGLGLVTDHRIERGTLLSVVLPCKDEFGSRRLVMSVKTADPLPSGEWMIGGEFARKLSAFELLALL
jgi:hypothetical protein